MIATLSLFVVAFAAEATAPAAATPAAEENKLICRRYPVTGSLVATKKVCHTKADWARVEETAQGEANRITQHISTERGN